MYQEIWKDIVNYEGCYQTSTHGRIRSIDRVVYESPTSRHPNGRYLNIRGRVLKPWMNNSGYLLVTLSMGNKKEHKLVHRLVAETFLPNPNNLLEVNHKCSSGDKTKNQVDNLEWTTHADNQKHAGENGLMARGERNKMSKLKASDIPIIRGMITQGLSNNKIAQMYPVSASAIQLIRSGKRWKHIK